MFLTKKSKTHHELNWLTNKMFSYILCITKYMVMLWSDGMDQGSKQLKKGVLEIIILDLLTEKDRYGYEIIKELAEKSGGYFELKEGTLYPILYRLNGNGL